MTDTLRRVRAEVKLMRSSVSRASSPCGDELFAIVRSAQERRLAPHHPADRGLAFPVTLVSVSKPLHGLEARDTFLRLSPLRKRLSEFARAGRLSSMRPDRPAKPRRAIPVSGVTFASSALSPKINIRQGAYLPHWSRDCATYFVTFRLADSLPRSVIDTWVRERDNIIQTASQLGRSPSIEEERRLQVLFSSKVDKYLDAGRGACWLREGKIARLVVDALRHFDGERYRLLAWCV